ncbi:MAG: hypothetical protein EZS28_012768 [Streblomastix strix]|uniref:Flavodoxin-like domain-containing protein n=1 Tax=Streblomastix strix TaxID=222440 RepID=A0A5J4W9T5_9EUKA|nr:MAG: hypothetical protein EZS28_012768 [Streblomastix strix]
MSDYHFNHLFISIFVNWTHTGIQINGAVTYLVLVKNIMNSFRQKEQIIGPPLNDPREFDIVLFGGPIWWKRMIPTLKSWLEIVKFSERSVIGTFQQCTSNEYEETYVAPDELIGKKIEKTVVFDKDHKNDATVAIEKLSQFAQIVISALNDKQKGKIIVQTQTESEAKTESADS